MDLGQLPSALVLRSDFREVSGRAQKVHDAIRHGRLHIHAHEGHTTVVVGTCLEPDRRISTGPILLARLR
ncbi:MULTISPECIES: hypothetical protein [unclassified Streptomyces]|uniref:hypothetical protein n=1 Tax=unclassified Streptomyces TaxID=2593676 RepID=UPI0038299050